MLIRDAPARLLLLEICIVKHFWIGTLLLFAVASSAPAPAQWLHAKKPKVNPTQRVPELILIIKTDADERKRLQAAEELREYDATTFSEIVPVLVDVALHDKKSNVRMEALTSLARIRPVTPMAASTFWIASRFSTCFVCREKRMGRPYKFCRNIAPITVRSLLSMHRSFRPLRT